MSGGIEIKVDEIVARAREIAAIWCPGHPWHRLGLNTREDFWGSARLEFGAPADLQPPESFWAEK